jgi:hypothetical protein
MDNELPPFKYDYLTIHSERTFEILPQEDGSLIFLISQRVHNKTITIEIPNFDPSYLWDYLKKVMVCLPNSPGWKLRRIEAEAAIKAGDDYADQQIG